MYTTAPRRQCGFTLIELMVGLVLSLLVTSALFWIYVGNVETTSNSVKAARLNNDLRSVMELMVSDIRRAGYWAGVVVPGTGVTNLFTSPNPFMDSANGSDIAIGNMTGEAANSCITYTYDANQDGLLNLGSPPPPREGFGFRLNTGALQFRRGGTLSLGNLGCDDGGTGWEWITDPAFVNVTNLSFRVAGLAGAPSSSCQNLSDASCGGDGDDANSCGDDAAVPRCCWRSLCSDTAGAGYAAPDSGDRLIETRLVAITLTGEVADDDTVTKTLAEFVKVRNDRALLAP